MKTLNFYDRAAIDRIRKKQKLMTILSIAAAVLTVAGWIVLLVTVTTLTERRNVYIALLVNGIGGCTSIALYLNGALHPRILADHIGRILQEPSEEIAFDRLSLDRNTRRIPHSIEIYTVTVKHGEETSVFFLCAPLAKNARLEDLPGVLTVSGRYIVSVRFGEVSA